MKQIDTVSLSVMKLFLIALISSFILTVAASLAHAQTGTTTRPTLTRPYIATDTAMPRLDARREAMATKSAALQNRLKNFRNKNKATIVERLNTNLNNVNDNRTAAMLRHLDKMATISGKLNDRLTNVSGKDTTAAQAALATANTNIETAKAAALVQSQKDYSITITSEANAKTEITTLRQQMFSDLKTTHDLVITARQSLSDAIMEAAKLSSQGGMNGVQ